MLLPLIAQPLLFRTLLLIFGGCCSNVYVLESILSLSSSAGTLITFLQFLFITLYTLPSQLTFTTVSPPDPPPLQPTQQVWFPRLKSRRVPVQKWLLFAAQFVMINVLNNAAFGYKISLPLHIILRSAGPVASMVVGSVWTGRRYSPGKIFAVVLLFAGVVVAALSDAGAKSHTNLPKNTPRSSSVISATSVPTSKFRSNSTTSPSQGTTTSALLDQGPGFALLTLALVLSAVLGIWSDTLYTRYGRTSKVANEQLFYGHLLALPFFAFQYPTLRTQYSTLLVADETVRLREMSNLPPSVRLMHHVANLNARQPSTWQQKLTRLATLQHVPNVMAYLVLNSITQIACISGVHHLSTQTSALTVSIVLNIRKVVSLLLSIWLFGNNLPGGVIFGAGVVFVGGALYGMPDKKPAKEAENQGGDGETKKSR